MKVLHWVCQTSETRQGKLVLTCATSSQLPNSAAMQLAGASKPCIFYHPWTIHLFHAVLQIGPAACEFHQAGGLHICFARALRLRPSTWPQSLVVLSTPHAVSQEALASLFFGPHRHGAYSYLFLYTCALGTLQSAAFRAIGIRFDNLLSRLDLPSSAPEPLQLQQPCTISRQFLALPPERRFVLQCTPL